MCYVANIARHTEIERENRILLEKMSNIMQKQPKTVTAYGTINTNVPLRK